MAQVILVGPAPGNWCIACLMDAKQKHWEMSADARKAGYEAPASDKPVVIGWPAVLDRELLDGPYRGVCGELPMLGVVDGLCWNHMAGTNPADAEVPVLDTHTRIPPGLLGKGKG